MKSAQREFDVVLYGASGFVGRQTVAYFAQHGQGLRWALAGRNRAKLEEVRKACGADAQEVGLIVADGLDSQALEALAERSHVVLSTAGPFAIFGGPLVAACVRHGTHYVDITGETPWVRGLIDQHHASAAASGTRIIPGCGFDSVPSDLGAWLVADALWQRYNEPCTSVKASFSMRGGLNGGTLASALNMMDQGQAKAFAQPFLLNPAGDVPADASRHADPVAPYRDSDFDAWLGPFVMGPINTRVVRRSAALLRTSGTKAEAQVYTSDFAYQEYMRFGSGTVAAMAAASFSFGMGATQGAMLFKPVRGVVRAVAGKLAPGPGQGPSEQAMDGGSFRCELIGRTASGKMARVSIADRGDPGNRATTKMVCESALALVHNLAELPGAPGRGGLLTPASGLGPVLASRLRDAGMAITVSI